MITGVLLGPSLFGLLWPSGQVYLFPMASRGILYAGAQLGLALYMFAVGLEFEHTLLRGRIGSAAAISVSGILGPCLLGCVLGVIYYRHGGFFPPGVTLGQALPFLAAAMSITAFPMLARIISERGLSGTRIGALSLASGALGDVAAWLVLALVLASLNHDPKIAVFAIGGGSLLAWVLFKGAQPLLRAIARRGEHGGLAERGAMAWLFALLMLSAWFADAIQLYAVFGAFMLGAAVPRGRFTERVRGLVEPITNLLLLPLFFIYSGLNTRLDLVHGAYLWGACGIVLVAAVVGKGGASYLAARATGEDHASSLGIGTLMNSRGLMELIIINIGLERGIISQDLFSMLVLMAIATTLMATPVFNLVFPPNRPVPSSKPAVTNELPA
jgi:Kef-type K+ transport system membrane component KefB